MKAVYLNNGFGDTEVKKTSIFFKLTVAFVIASVFFALFAVVYVNRTNAKKQSIVPDFVLALDERRYDDALTMYRELHDKVVSVNPDSTQDISFEVSMMNQMEEAVATRVENLENQIRYERYTLGTDDIYFLDSMGELTGFLISDWLNSLCEEFLLGTIEKPSVVFIFNQFTSLSNISATATPLLREIDSIEMSCGSVQASEQYYTDGDYVNAVLSYMEVAEDTEGFVHTFCSRRVDEIKDVMYEPMLNTCEHMLDNMQYYSAEEVLSGLAVVFPDDARINSDLLIATGNTSPVVSYNGQVSVLCVRQLIADTDMAFGARSKEKTNLTTSEFQNILQQLYDRNYVLVDAESLAGLENDTYLVEQNLTVPEGKKPIIIVIENLDYSPADYADGTCERLVLNDQGQVCGEYINSDGQSVVRRSAEAIGILDAFVEEHPDFSYNGVKGVISICGFDSVFGYVVDQDQVDDYNFARNAAGFISQDITDSQIEVNRQTVTSIAGALKDSGWKFASSTYAGIADCSEAEMSEITEDTEKWLNQIGSLLGEVHMVVYPNGEYINGTDERAEYLKNMGFRIFFGIGSQPYYTYGNNYLYYDRAVINFTTLDYTDYEAYFDATVIPDPARPTEEE